MLFSDFTNWFTRATSFLTRDGSPRVSSSDGPLKVAIIGAGITGSTAAYRLHALSRTTSEPISITIYEAADRTGGHIKTVLPQQNSNVPMEAGASHFFLDNWCLTSAVQDLNLSLWNGSHYPATNSYGEPAVWDGEKFRIDSFLHEQHPPQGNWAPPQIWDRVAWHLGQLRFTAELWMQYGQEPWTFQQAMRKDLAKWHNFGRPSQPFSDLQAEFDRTGLHNTTTTSAQQYLKDLDVGSGFSRDFIEPWTRTMFSNDLSRLTGLAPAMMPWQSSRQLASVEGGNAALISSLIARSEAAVRLNTRVTAIEQGRKHRYRLTYYTTTTTEFSQEKEHAQDEFDAVIVAAPLPRRTLRSMRSSPVHVQLPHKALSSSEQRRIHTTHFATMFKVPIAKLLTHPPALSNATTERGGPDSAQPVPRWLSLSQHRRSVLFNDGCGPDDNCDQFEDVYRVVSTDRLSDEDLAGLIEVSFGAEQLPMVLDRSSWEWERWGKEADGEGEELGVGSLLAGDGRGELEIAPGLVYVGGGGRVLDMLEMGCRMGRNGAALVLGVGQEEMLAESGKPEL